MQQNLMFTDFIQLEKLQSVLKKLCAFVEMGCCIVAPNRRLIIEESWDCLCTNTLHDVEPTDFRQCIQSQRFFAGHVGTEGEKRVFTCRQGFSTIGASIHIDELYIASIFIGPFIQQPDAHDLSNLLFAPEQQRSEIKIFSPPLVSPETIQQTIDHLDIFVELIEEMGRNQVVEIKAGAALKKSEERYRTIIDSLPQIVFETDREGRMVFLNQSAREILGVPEDFLGQEIDITYFIPDNEHESIIDQFSRILNGELLPSIETLFRRSNGTIFPALLSLLPIEENAGGVSGVRGVLFDISAHRQTELELFESQLRYKALFEKSHDAMLLIEKGKIVEYNIKAAALFHKSRGDLAGASLPLLVDSLVVANGDQASENLDTLLFDREPESTCMEWKFTLADGQQIETEVEVNHVDLPGRNIMQITLRDVTMLNQEKRQLETRESAWRALFQYAPFGIAINRLADGVYLDANPALVKQSGKSITEILGKSAHDFTPQPQRSAANEVVKTLIEKGYIGIQETDVLNLQGDIRSVLYSAATFQSGDEVNVVSMVIDITKRKEMERKLQQSEARMQSLYQAVPIGLAVLKDRVLLAANERLAEITGYPMDALLDQSSRWLYFSDKDFEAVGKALYRAPDSRGRGYIETRFRHKDGSTRYISLFAAPLEPDNPQEGAVVAIQDITAQKKMLQALQDSEERFRSIMEQSTFSMMLLSPDGNVLHVNEACLKLWGVGREFENTYNILTDPQLEKLGLMPVIRQAMAREQVSLPATTYDLSATLGEGVLRTVQGDFYPARDANGTVRHVILIQQDVTERQRAEEALRLNEARLEALMELNQMRFSSLNEMAQFAMNAAVRLTQSTLGYIAFVNEEQTELTLHAWSQETMEKCRIEEKPLVYRLETTGLWGETFRQRKPIITNDCTGPSPWTRGYPEGHVMLMRHMGVPVLDGDRVVIVAGVGDKETDYDEADIRQLRLLMTGMWQILQRKRAADALRDREERLQQQNTALLKFMSRGTLFQSDLQQAVAEVTEACSALINTERVSVWLYSEDYADIRCIDLYNQSMQQHSFGATLQSKEFPTYTASHQKGELIAVADVYTDPRTHDIPVAYFREHDIRSLLDAPVWLHDRLGGILSFEHVGEQRLWTHEDERLASNMAALLTLCFETDERKRAQAALQKSESQLANAVKIAKLGHWELDIESGVFTFTDSLYDIFHTTAKDVGGYQMSIDEYAKRFVHTEDAWCVTEEFYKSVKTNDPNFGCQLEHRVFYADGGIGYIAVRYFVVKNHHGKTIKTYGVNQDITERKLAEIALQRSELRYRSLFEGAGDAILIMKDGVIVDCNHKTLDILQCTREEIIGRSLEEFAPPEQPDGQNSVAQSKQLLSEAEQGRNLAFEWLICRPNGTFFFSEVSLRSIDLSGYLVVQTIVRDISERKKNEKFLRESEFRFRSFFNTNPEGILLLDFQGRILDANKAFLRNSGYSLPECRMTSFKAFVPEIDQGKIIQALLNLRSGISQQEPLQSSYRAKDGRIVPVSFRGWLVVDEESKPIYLGVFIKDLTTEKALIADKNALEKQVIRAQKSEAIGTLAGGIAHDFNNILGGIIGYTELALYLNPAAIDSKIKGYLERVLEGGKRAKNLVQQILRFSRNTDTVMGPINLIPLIKETLLLLQSTLPKTITFEKNIVADPDKILGDSTQIHQVIMNLATNAYHAMRETGGILTVTITNLTLLSAKQFMTMTIPPGEYIKITIADTGCGMSPEIVERIFEPYFTTKGVDEGTGLGMAVVAGIVKCHKGLIEIQTAPGKGSVFDIYFPSFQGGNTGKELLDSTRPLGNGEKILIVDDEAYFLEVVYENLKMLGYNVQSFQRSFEALQEIRNNHNQYDLLITDQTMPEMTGVQLAQEVRKINSSIPIILCTGFSEVVTEESSSYYGIDRFLMKPVNVDEMAKTVADITFQAKSKK